MARCWLHCLGSHRALWRSLRALEISNIDQSGVGSFCHTNHRCFGRFFWEVMDFWCITSCMVIWEICVLWWRCSISMDWWKCWCVPLNFPAFQLFYLFGVVIVCFMFVSASWSCMSNENSIFCFHILINLWIYYVYMYTYACGSRSFSDPFLFFGWVRTSSHVLEFGCLPFHIWIFARLNQRLCSLRPTEARTSTARASGTNVSKQLKRLRKTEAWSHHTWRSFCWTAWDVVMQKIN